MEIISGNQLFIDIIVIMVAMVAVLNFTIISDSFWEIEEIVFPYCPYSTVHSDICYGHLPPLFDHNSEHLDAHPLLEEPNLPLIILLPHHCLSC